MVLCCVVNDSIILFVGSIDLCIGCFWGGVIVNGGCVEMSLDDVQIGVYVYGVLYSLMGCNVEFNICVELGGGVYQYLVNGNDEKMMVGVFVIFISYVNNQNFYIYGYGGYFSLQVYLGLGVLVIWVKCSDCFSFQLKGLVGVQYFCQDGVDYFFMDVVL